MKWHTDTNTPGQERNGRVSLALLSVLLLTAFLTTGCQQMAILWFHMTGGDTVKARYKLTSNMLAVVLDDPEGLIVLPETYREFYNRLEQEFLANNIKARLIPFEEWQRLRQRGNEYDDLSVRAIGEKLGADEVLYLKTTDFRLKREPAAPIYEGRFVVRVSIISTERKRDVRLFPQEEGGVEVAAETKPETTEGDATAADVARRLSAELARRVTRLFYDHKEID
jgi:hypothetical protein